MNGNFLKTRTDGLALTGLLVCMLVLAGCGESPPDTTQSALSPPVREGVAQALKEYETLRGQLAADDWNNVSATAQKLEDVLGETVKLASGAEANELGEASMAAQAMGRAPNMEAARAAFAPLSQAMIHLTAQDASLMKGRHLFECPMVDGFNLWLQPSTNLENPYMGTKMLKCGSETGWDQAVSAATEHRHSHDVTVADTDGDGIAFYTCPMHPSIKQPGEGTCPLCSMDLVPVTNEEMRTGVVRIDTQRRQKIGVKTAPITVRPVVKTIRAVATVQYDETRLEDVTLKIEGWIGELHANTTGQHVRRGDPLFTLYSPELYTAQQEYLSVLESQRRAVEQGAPQRSAYLVRAARERLRLWDLSTGQIDRIGASGKPLEYVPILSPATGYIVEKNVVEGAAVQPGERLFRIAGLDRVWLEAEVYESDLPMVVTGQTANITLPNLPNKTLQGKVTFIYPYLEGSNRTGKVRIELGNANLDLKPDMFANVVFEVDLGTRLMVPESAVIYSGTGEVVFLDLGEGRLRPQRIEVGTRTDDYFEVLSGLNPGDVVVTSGNFLIAAETRLKTAMENW